MSLDYFGTPFSHPEHPSEQWVRHDKAIVDKVSLKSIICQRSFYRCSSSSGRRMPVLRIWSSTPLRKPDNYARATFGSEHGSNKRGPATRARYSKRPSDNQQVAVITQSIVQDYLWLHNAGKAILAKQWPLASLLCPLPGRQRQQVLCRPLHRLGFSNAVCGCLARLCERKGE